MKRILAAAIIAGGLLQAQAISYQYTDLNESTKSCTLSSWSGAEPSGVLVLPETYTQAGVVYTVTAIAPGALNNLTKVTTVFIPKNINKIGKVTALTLDETANFMNCPNLEKFTVESGNNSFTVNGSGVLMNVGSRNIVRVPQKVVTDDGVYKVANSVVAFCYDAFAENATITELRLSPNMTDFESNGGLNDMKNLGFIDVNGTTVPKNYSVQYGVLYDLNKTTLISYPPRKQGEAYTAPTTVKTVGDAALANTGYLYGATISGATTYGKRAFAGSGITQYSISSKVTRIQEGMFRGCPRLGKIGFNRDIEIPEYFAADCPQLTAVSGTSMSIKIDDFAFYNCPKLASFPFTANTNYTGESIFDGCGFEQVVYGTSNYSGDFSYMGTNFLANNKKLTTIDLSKVTTATEDDSFDWGVGMTWGCDKLTTIKLPSLTAFWYNPNNQRSVFEPNCPFEHIEIGAFYPGHAPIITYTQGESYPKIYVKTTDAPSKCCPLNKLITVSGSAVVRPVVYCEAWSMINDMPYASEDEYVIPNSDYYVPGNTLQNYKHITGQIGRIYESYLFQSVNMSGKYSLMLMPMEPHLVFTDVLINGKSAGIPNASGMLHTDLAYNAVDNIRVNYEINGVKMTTYYPTKENESGIENIDEIGQNEAPAYDIQGRPVPADYKGITISAGKKQIKR